MRKEHREKRWGQLRDEKENERPTNLVVESGEEPIDGIWQKQPDIRITVGNNFARPESLWERRLWLDV